MLWGSWVKQTIGKGERCSRKFRQVARVLGPFKKFYNLALRFDCIYADIQHIEGMFKNVETAQQWR